jgi:hypothetical protein
MKALTYVLAVAVIVGAGAAAIAGPALATPNRTDSVGGPTAPFFTPISSTRSQSTGVGSFTVGVIGLGLQVQCPAPSSRMSAYAGPTHTQLRVTELSAGNRAVRCPVMPAGWKLDSTEFTCTATSTNPWLYHITFINSANPNSVTGTLNNTSGCKFTITDGAGRSCVIAVDPGQSLRGRYTQLDTSLTVAELNVVVTISNGVLCPWVGSFNGQVSGIWTLRADTGQDPRVGFTGAS